MVKVPAYARFVYTMTVLKKEAGDSGYEGCDEILCYMAVKEAEGRSVKITELVQSLKFGTGPTIKRKVDYLVNHGLISMIKSKTDARAKDLSLTAAAINHIKERSRLLKQSLDS